MGCGVRSFASAEAFLASPGHESVACIICDVQMPGMTGVEMQNNLVAQGSTIPIIFITAFPSDELRRRVLANGAAAFMHKPLDLHEFMSCLDAVLHRD
jgi:FixJ family two-component response regulator